jgi:type VI secretion system protein VasJ
MTPERREQIVALGKDPISPSSPCGDPVRYDEIFERLQAQMDRIGSLSGEVIDWREVVSLSTEILKSKSKDLLVMTYAALGLFETEGYAGLAAAFEAYRQFLTSFWENCYPKIKPPHGRVNAVQYLVDKVLASVELKGGQAKRHPKEDEKKYVHECADAVAQLDSAVTTAFASQPETPNMLQLVRAFKALKEKVGPLVTAAPAAAPQPAAAPAEGTAPGPAAPISDTFASPAAALQAVIRIAKYLLAQDNKDARGYRLMRSAYFGGWSEPPKDRIVPGPTKPQRESFEKLAADGNWTELLTRAEGQFAVTPLWLDMQRYVAVALNGLGPMYKAAADAVALETLALQSRLPTIFDLCFKDGTPFADAATKAWLNEVGGRLGGGGGGGAAADGDPLGGAIAEARKLLSEAKGVEAVERLTQEVDGSGSRRHQFRAQLALAGFCMDMNRLALASSILEGLERRVDEYHLEDWEPDLAAKALARLYECLMKSKPRPTPEEAQRVAGVFSRVCRLDPAAALKLEAAVKATK